MNTGLHDVDQVTLLTLVGLGITAAPGSAAWAAAATTTIACTPSD